KPETPADSTLPGLNLSQPAGGTVYTTTAYSLTFTGQATDAGSNLSRLQVKNLTRNVEGWDYALAGANADFRVAGLGLAVGYNNIQLTVYDDAGNSGQRNVTVRRLGQVAGAVLIIAGHNETFGLQSNIYNAANRAYRIFRSAGFGDESIQYLAPAPQDATVDGTIDTDGDSSPAAIQQAITVWAASRVGPDKPLYIYLVAHGLAEKFCASGCNSSGAITPQDLNQWLDALEAATGLDQVTVVFEACQSGSFIDRNNGPLSGLGKSGRVIITSTGSDNNAYASAEGAYFSDAFFSCVADSNNLKACFDQAVAAVAATGVNQTPWLDDNGDGIYNAGDGGVAQGRVITRFFSSVRPQLGAVTLERTGANGLLTAQVTEGAEEIGLVWAVLFPPSFVEPNEVTLNLNVPTVRLEPVANTPGQYRFTYQNGLLEEGDYRVVFYAQDRLGIHALPRRLGQVDLIYLPIVQR
ncbi:MAG TPA: C13 family peptidase, partial [Caldilineaceae bacterium]|nr:C13 family peptidase [Caldilineaceae bacterium]